jgi:TonB family protein
MSEASTVLITAMSILLLVPVSRVHAQEIDGSVQASEQDVFTYYTRFSESYRNGSDEEARTNLEWLLANATAVGEHFPAQLIDRVLTQGVRLYQSQGEPEVAMTLIDGFLPHLNPELSRRWERRRSDLTASPSSNPAAVDRAEANPRPQEETGQPPGISQFSPPPEEDSPSPEEESQEVFIVVEDRPELIGGMAALQKATEYPEFAKKAGIEGRVFVQFIVDEQGRVLNPQVTRSVHKLLDQAAVEAVKQMRFKPGKQRGEAVKVQMSLPVTFRTR